MSDEVDWKRLPDHAGSPLGRSRIRSAGVVARWPEQRTTMKQSRQWFSVGAAFTLLLALSCTTPAQAAGYTTARCGNSSGRVLITFDDWNDVDPYRATRTGAYLKKRGVRAAFFLINAKAERYPDIVTELRRQGHYVLNHTYSHPHLTELSDAEIRQEILDGEDSNRLRPPYGDWDARVAGMASELGYRICWNTVNTKDWQQFSGNYRSVFSIRSIVRNAPTSDKQSGVIQGHLYSNYPDAMGGIIDDLHAQGFRLCRNTGPVSQNMPYPMACSP